MRPVIKQSFIGQSAAIRNLKIRITKVSLSDVPVLITSETGTGKELIARQIHSTSHRRLQSFEPLNCGSIPRNLLESQLFGHERGAFTGAYRDRKGIFELANKGTVFLDEIGDAPIYLQHRLLRVLQEKSLKRIGGRANIPVDFRLICATNQDLVQKINSGEFRSDLFYRINVVRINIPPLRERREDIPLLIKNFIADFPGPIRTVKENFRKHLIHLASKYDWPGNVQELKSYVDCSLVLDNPDAFFEQDLPNLTVNPPRHGSSDKDLKELILKFHSVSDPESRAAVLLKINFHIIADYDKDDPLLYESLKRRNLEQLIGCGKDSIINAVKASHGSLENVIRDNGSFIKKKTSNSFIYPASLLNPNGIAS